MRTKSRQIGSVLFEFAACLLVVLSVTILFWNEWAKQELSQSFLVAGMGTLNDPLLSSGSGWDPFTTDSGGSVTYYDSSNSAHVTKLTAILSDLSARIVNKIKSGSGYSGTSKDLRCAVQLAYFYIDTANGSATQGKVLPTKPYITLPPVVSIDTGVDPTIFGNISLPANDALKQQISTEVDGYFDASIGKKLFGGTGKVQLSPGAEIEQIVFPYAPLLVWGCAAKSSVIGFGQIGEVLLSGVTVPANSVGSGV